MNKALLSAISAPMNFSTPFKQPIDQIIKVSYIYELLPSNPERQSLAIISKL